MNSSRFSSSGRSERPPLGFVLVTHNQPEQALYLCQRLTEMFAEPPIAIHHDFSQCDLDRQSFPANVRFVDPWVTTGWGTIGVVDALLATIRLMYAGTDNWGDPDWITSLSAADYPIQTAETILADLRSSPYDGYLDSRAVQRYPGRFRNEPLGEFPFQQPRYHQFAFNRYMAQPVITMRFARRWKLPFEAYVLRSQWLVNRFTPFGEGGLTCYAGDAWMTVRREVAKLFITETPMWKQLREHLEKRASPEEAFYHCLTGNTPALRMCSDNLRWTDWKGCYAHPRTLGRDDFPKLLATHQHFARKFPFEPALLHALDEAVAAKRASVDAGSRT